MGHLTVSYKKFAYLDGTLRNDWYSTLPKNNNAILSKSVGGTFVFSDLIENKISWLNFGKIRASWGEIPKALGGNNYSFGAYRYPGSAFMNAQNKFGNNLVQTASNTLVDPNISGSVVSQSEIGLDIGIFKDRATLSTTLWQGKEYNFPYSLSLNGATGYTQLLTNIGKIDKQGIDIQFTVRPIVLDNFSWKISGNFGRLIKNDVVELSEKYNITQTGNLGGVWGSRAPNLVHAKGKRWGQIYGNGIKRDSLGRAIVDANGFYENDPNVYFGSVLPNFTGGVQNQFVIKKNITINVNIDYQSGGKFVSLSNMWGSYSGLTAATATLNDKGNPVRDPVALGGGVHVVGVLADGTASDKYVEAQDYFHNLYGKSTFDPYVLDLTFIKLREVSIGYELPVKRLGLSRYVKSANFSIVGRNLLLLYAKSPDYDPSEIAYSYGETGQWPGTRGLGFNLRLGF